MRYVPIEPRGLIEYLNFFRLLVKETVKLF